MQEYQFSSVQTLKAHGADVLVLESENRIGGRIQTDYSMGPPFEIGAGWIHGPKFKNPIKKLSKKISAKTFITNDENYVLFDDKGREVSKKKFDTIDDGNLYLTISIMNWIWAIIDRFWKLLMLNFLTHLMILLSWAFSAYTEFDKGASLGKLSAYYHDEDDYFDGKDPILTEGYDKNFATVNSRLKHQAEILKLTQYPMVAMALKFLVSIMTFSQIM